MKLSYKIIAVSNAGCFSYPSGDPRFQSQCFGFAAFALFRYMGMPLLGSQSVAKIHQLHTQYTLNVRLNQQPFIRHEGINELQYASQVFSRNNILLSRNIDVPLPDYYPKIFVCDFMLKSECSHAVGVYTNEYDSFGVIIDSLANPAYIRYPKERLGSELFNRIKLFADYVNHSELPDWVMFQIIEYTKKE